jgi:hypothetical protein
MKLTLELPPELSRCVKAAASRSKRTPAAETLSMLNWIHAASAAVTPKARKGRKS